MTEKILRNIPGQPAIWTVSSIVSREDVKELLIPAVDLSIGWSADLHLPIHTNAGGGVGTEVFIGDENERGIANAILKSICSITPSRVSRGVKKRPSLIEIDSTPFCAYVEVDFHDNKASASWIISSTSQIAQAIAMAICEYFSVEYIPPFTDHNASVGDKVYFLGDKHYTSSGTKKSYSATPGIARVTHVAPGTPHPYHLVGEKEGSSVYGWCNAQDVEVIKSNSNPLDEPVSYVRGQKIKLIDAPLYSSSVASKKAATKKGVFYIYDGILINNRYRVTTKPQYVDKRPTSLYTTGYVNLSDINPE